MPVRQHRSRLFRADIFSQNEVEGIADRTTSQLELIDRFEPERIAALNTRIGQVQTDLVAGLANSCARNPMKTARQYSMARSRPVSWRRARGIRSCGCSKRRSTATTAEPWATS
jgi:hypothetical protein